MIAQFYPYSEWAFSGLLTDVGMKKAPLLKNLFTYLAKLKLG